IGNNGTQRSSRGSAHKTCYPERSLVVRCIRKDLVICGVGWRHKEAFQLEIVLRILSEEISHFTQVSAIGGPERRLPEKIAGVYALISSDRKRRVLNEL